MRTIFAVALVALAGAFQDDLERKIDALIPQLSDEQIAAREDATRALYDLGSPALPFLKKRLEKLEGEAKGRIGDVIRRIELRETREKLLPPLKLVSLDFKHRPARDVISEIERQTGIPMDYSKCSVDDAISIRLKDATPLQALDEVRKKTGQLNCKHSDDYERQKHSSKWSSKTTPLIFRHEPFIERPTTYVRHYRFQVTQMEIRKNTNFQEVDTRCWLDFNILWTPDVKPGWFERFEITELRDDQGRLIPLSDTTGKNTVNVQSLIRGRCWANMGESQGFEHPKPDAKKIETLKGIALLRFPLETKTLTFEKPAESVGKSIEVEGYKITLKGYSVEDNAHAVGLELSGQYAGPETLPDGRHGLLSDLASREDIEMLIEGGEILRNSGGSAKGDDKRNQLGVIFSVPGGKTVKELRIRCVLSHFYDEVKFEIKDIPFPK